MCKCFTPFFLGLLFTIGIFNSRVSAETIQGIPDNTSGVYMYSAGADESSVGACDGLPAGLPTADIIQDALNFNLLTFIGDEPEEILGFVSGGEQETPISGEVDTTQAEIVEGLTAIDDFGDIANGDDDSANFDVGTSGEFHGGFRNPYEVIMADGVVATGLLGGATAASSASEADDNLGGMEIFIFEDSELSGFQLELYGPVNTWIINLNDFQLNPGSFSAADDILFGIDLDSLPGWDGTYIIDMRLIDDGVERATVDSCLGTGVVDQSLEIDAIAVRTSVIIPSAPTAVLLGSQNTSTFFLIGWLVLLAFSIAIAFLAVGRSWLRSDTA